MQPNANLKKVYQQATQQVQNIVKITTVQESQANRFLSPLIPFDVFRDFLANRETRKDKGKGNQQPHQAEEEGGGVGVHLKLLPYFLQERVRLRAIKFLPVLVHFYKSITSSFSYRLTEQQTMELTVPKCIDLISTLDRHKTNLADTLTKQWEEFMGTCGRIFTRCSSLKYFFDVRVEIRELLAELEGCPDQQRNRQFESYIMQVDNNTLMGTLISHPNSLEQTGEIIRIANELVKKQNSVRYSFFVTPSPLTPNQMLQKREYYGKWNQHQLIFEDTCTQLNLAHLPLDSGTLNYILFLLVLSSGLLIRAEKQDMLITGNYNQQDFEQFILSLVSLDDNFSRNALHFDVRRIKRQVSNSPLCTSYLHSLRRFWNNSCVGKCFLTQRISGDYLTIVTTE